MGLPQWKPHWTTITKADSPNREKRMKTIRNCASNFIKKKEVKEFVFSRDNYKCVYCGTTKNLTVDHIVSVYLFATGKYDFEKLNDYSNLQTLCSNCNSAKKPEKI